MGSQYQMALGGASLAIGLTNTLTFGSNGLFTVNPGPADKLALKLSTNSVLLTGSFSPPSGTNTNSLYGAFISPALGGSGYFLDTNSQTGWFQISPP